MSHLTTMRMMRSGRKVSASSRVLFAGRPLCNAPQLCMRVRWMSVLRSTAPATSHPYSPGRYHHNFDSLVSTLNTRRPSSSSIPSRYLVAVLLFLGAAVSYHTASPASSAAPTTRLYKWGNGNPTPQLLTPLTDITQIAAGGNQSLFLTSTNQLYSCHRDDNNTPRPVPLPPSTLISSLSCSDSHCAFVTTDGHAYLWWPRPHKSSSHPTTPTLIPLDNIKQVSCGRSHTLLLTRDGQVYALGKCTDGSLGIGPPPPNVTRALTPVLIPSTSFPSPVQSVAAGSGFSLFLTDTGRVFGCGDNNSGQLAQPLTAPRYFFTPHPIDSYTPIQGVWAGEQTSALLDSDGKLWMVGKGDEGQLGGGAETRGVFNSGLREVGLSGRVRGVELGFAHSGVVVEEGGKGRLRLWGRGREGQLGGGDRGGSVASGVDHPKPVTALGDKDVLAIGLGNEHTLALVREWRE